MTKRTRFARAGPLFAAMLFAAAVFAIPYGGGTTNPLGSPTPIGVAIMASTTKSTKPASSAVSRNRLGPIPPDNFDNDLPYGKVDTKPGSAYDRAKKRLAEREAKEKK